MIVSPWLWVLFTVIAAGGQTLRNALQRELIQTLGTVGATHVRFLFGLPFGILFLTVILTVTGHQLPAISGQALAWTTAGALAQIGATALLLAAMKERSFVVSVAYSKTEPVQVALFGLVFLGDQLTLGLILAILIATAGVMVMSWPKAGAMQDFSWHPVLLGLASASLFAVAAIGFRGGIKALELPNFVVAASTILVLGLIIQTVTLSAYLALRERDRLAQIFRAWRPSMLAGFIGAFASQMWFLAFALESAAKIRTLALIEILFAQLISRQMFKQGMSAREAFGIGLIVLGVGLLLNFERLGLS